MVTTTSRLITAQELHERDMQDPEYRAEWERTRLASEVSIKVLLYRQEHGLSQTAFGRLVGMRQSHVCRLEAADNPPTLAMLTRIATATGIEFLIEIGPDGVRLANAD